jgi:hypothetical protein
MKTIRERRVDHRRDATSVRPPPKQESASDHQEPPDIAEESLAARNPVAAAVGRGVTTHIRVVDLE